jgi:hypothetical protein
MRILSLFAVCLLLAGCKKETTAETTDVTPAASEKTNADAPAEFADAKYTEIGKKAMAAMASGDMDAWMSNYADNAKYFWNGGDSLVGKPAIDKFWRDRRGNVIESLSYKNDIWLPIKVNKPQATEQSGVWLLAWYEVTAKYKGGSSMTQWMHFDYHFDANDKIDRVVHYVDRLPVREAMPKK